MKELAITTEYIELQNVLKILGVIESGGQSKIFLKENEVLVNGIKEDRRGRKLRDGDKVEVLGKTCTIKNAN